MLILSAASWLAFFGGEIWPAAGRALVIVLIYGVALAIVLRQPASAPVATGRAGSLDQSLHEPS